MDSKYYINKHGIRIVKCCASCQHKDLHAGNRVCLMTRSNIKGTYVCREWKVAEHLANAGKGDGKVKKKEYLQFVMDNRNPRERLSNLAVHKAEFEKEHGSIYINK